MLLLGRISIPAKGPPDGIQMNPRDARSCGFYSCGFLEARTNGDVEVLDAWPARKGAPRSEPLEALCGDGIKRNFERRFGADQVVGGGQVGRVQAVAKEDVEELSRDAPAPSTPG